MVGAGEKWEGGGGEGRGGGGVDVFGALTEFGRFRSFWRQQRRQVIGRVRHVEERLRGSIRGSTLLSPSGSHRRSQQQLQQ